MSNAAQAIGQAAVAQAQALIAAGAVVASADVAQALAAVAQARNTAGVAGSTKQNTSAAQARQLKADNRATLDACWLCGGALDGSNAAMAQETDHLLGGADHRYNRYNTAAAHALCNRTRGVLQAGGMDLAGIVAKAQALPQARQAQAGAVQAQALPSTLAALLAAHA